MLQGYTERSPYESGYDWLAYLKNNWQEAVAVSGEELARRHFGEATRLVQTLDEHARLRGERMRSHGDKMPEGYFERGRLYVPELDGELVDWYRSPVYLIEMVGQKEFIHTAHSSRLGFSPAMAEEEKK